MVYRLGMDKLLGIGSLHASGMSQRRITDSLGISRKAVRRQLLALESKVPQRPTGWRSCGTMHDRAFLNVIVSKLEQALDVSVVTDIFQAFPSSWYPPR